MTVLLLLVIVAVAALVLSVNSTGQGRQAVPAPPALPAPETAETLALRLPEPYRTRAWRILCAVVDAQATPDLPDARTRYLLEETRRAYLPDTLRAYLNLTDGAQGRLAAQGQPAGTLLAEQLTLIEDGVGEALRRDHAAADRLLTQGRFLRERFGAEGGERGLPRSRP